MNGLKKLIMENKTWRWNKTYFAETSCCYKKFKLDKTIGDMLSHDEDIVIMDSDLNEIYQVGVN